MRLASFNVENFFSRVRAMNQDELAEGRPILEEYARVNVRLQKPVYNAADKKAILASLKALGLDKATESKWAYLRENRGHLIKKGAIVAGGRGDWTGWGELKKEVVNETATKMTARVIKDVRADVLAIVEAEDRPTLNHFNDVLLRPIAADYRQIMLIDGNDDRGIDVGMLTRPGYAIESIVSHVDDEDDGGKTVFSRDCPEYRIHTNNATMLVLVNHLKSKGFG